MKAFKFNVKNIGESGKCWILLSIAISFMLCVFAPLEMFFSNQAEFWFEITHLLPVMLSAFVLVNIILFLIYRAVKKSEKCGWITYGLFFCLMLYLYIQGNYVPRNYGVLNGVDIQWDSYPGYAIASIVLGVLAFIAWVIVVLKVKEKVYAAGKLVCTILVLIQLVTIGTLVLQNSFSNETSSKNTVVTIKDMFNLSKDKNIIVFVLDSFDSFVMLDMLESEAGAEYEELFENFVYWPDTVGAFPTTKGALPQILTGKWYENDKPYVDYVSDAYIDNEIYKNLEENGYSIGVYTDSGFLNPESEMYTNVEAGSYVVGNYGSFAQKIYKLVAFNYMPHQLKRFFYTTSSELENVRESTMEYAGYSYDVQKFYKTLQEEGMKITDEENCFRVYHLEGIHVPYTFGEELESKSDVSYEVYDEAKGNFTLLKMYFDKLKEENIYDNSTIIIMADHGYTGLGQNPIFMVKNAGVHQSFKISDQEMTYEYLDNIFVSLSNGEDVNEKYIGDLTPNDTQRRFVHYSWDNSWDKKYLPNMAEYVAVGTAMDYANFNATGRVFAPLGEMEKYAYTLETELTFGEEQTANRYVLYGFSENTGEYTWTDGLSAAMLFAVEDDFEVLKVILNYSTYGETQRVIIYANDNEVANYIARGAETREIYIPKECVNETELVLKFEFPDAESPASHGESTDERKLALSMREMTISAISEEEYVVPNSYVLNEQLSFKEENTASQYIIDGFSSNEENFTWTNGKTAELLFDIAEVNSDLEIEMEYFTYTESQQVIVLVNGNVIEDYVANGAETKSFTIPVEYIKSGRIHITLELPDAVSPANLGKGTDTRELALAMKTILISPQN